MNSVELVGNRAQLPLLLSLQAINSLFPHVVVTLVALGLPNDEEKTETTVSKLVRLLQVLIVSSPVVVFRVGLISNQTSGELPSVPHKSDGKPEVRSTLALSVLPMKAK